MRRIHYITDFFRVAIFLILLLFIHSSTALCAPDLSSVKIDLTDEERAFLAEHFPIRVGIMSDWPPLNYVDESGEPAGLGSEYLNLINERLGNVLFIDPSPFHESYEMVKKGKLDAMMDITPNDEREPFFEFTSPYLVVPHVIVARKDGLYFSSEEDLKGKTIGLEKGYYNIEHFRKNHPEVRIREFKSTRDALDAVAKGEVDAYAGNRAVSMYIMEKELLDGIKAHGKLTIPGIELSIGVREELPILAKIFDKALNSITEKERREINAHYISGHYESWYDSAEFWIVFSFSLGIIIILIFLAIFWNRSLKRQVKLRTEALTRENRERMAAEDGMRESEERYRALFEGAGDAIFLARDGLFVDCNAKTLEMFSCRKEDIINTSPYGNSPKLQPDGRDSQEKALENMDIALREGHNFFEWEHCRLDGTPFAAEVSLSRLYIRGEVHLLAIVRDITERKKAMRDLAISHERFMTVMNSIGSLIYVADMESYELLFVNEYGLNIWGRDMVGKKCWQALQGLSGPCSFCTNDKLLDSSRAPGEIYRWEFQNTLDHKWYDIRDRTIRWIDGRIVRLEIATDITERKKVEQELISKKTQLEHISDNLDEAMIYQVVRFPDDSRKIEYVSGKVKDFYGVTPDEMKADISLLYGKVHPEDIARVHAEELAALAKMKPLRVEARVINPDGSLRWSYFVSVPQAIEGGTRWDGVEFNITERKRSEDALREALNIRSAFTSMVSHELRTPLTVIRESIFLMSRGLLGPINEKQKRHLEMEEKNVTRLSNLLGQVLDYQAMEAGKLKFSMEKNDINAVIRDAYATMSSLAEKKGLQFNLDLEEGLPEFEFDRDRIVEVIINLLSNAIKLTDRGSVTVKSARSGGRVRVSVTDTGPGIRQEDIPRLFRHFEQLYRMPGGTGLGLAISKNIILAHDGEIWPESVYGQGTTFHFEIPIERRGEHGEKNPDSE